MNENRKKSFRIVKYDSSVLMQGQKKNYHAKFITIY